MSDLLGEAQAGGYAVCYCESWNLESFQAVVEAAEEMGSPIIAGFNGGFLRHRSRLKPEKLIYYAAIRSALQESSAPIAFLLNETDDFEQIRDGIELGFNAVMVESDNLDADDYSRLVKRVVDLAHAKGVSVEAQVGRLPHGSEEGHRPGSNTDPKRAQAFVEQTRVDALGISIGNVHILTKGKASIDLECLARLREYVDIPLVIHGGTGFPSDCAREAIALGVAKFNFGTNLKQAWLAALRKALDRYEAPMNPHPFLGMGGPDDVTASAREAVKQKVKELIKTYTFPGVHSKPQPRITN
jgi:ketose-bisphosphate aldolase